MDKPTCSAADCGGIVHARGLCPKHHQRLLRLGTVELPQRLAPTCAVSGCPWRGNRRGYCNGHYKRLVTFGDVQADIPLQKKRRGRTETCSVEGCGRTYMAKGLCGKHYDLDRRARLAQELCTIADCDRSRSTNAGYCDRHYQRWLKYGDPTAGGDYRCLRGTGDRWAADEARRVAGAKMSMVTGETRVYVKILRGDPCVYCGDPCEHIDHIIPFIDGGPTDCTNLAPACASCNHQKSDTDLLTFMLKRLPVAA